MEKSTIIIITFLSIMIIIFILIKKYIANKKSVIRTSKKQNAKGIVFGIKKGLIKRVVYSPTESEGAVLTVATSGTGKTTAIAIPSLRAWEGTSFTIDISGDIEPNIKKDNKLVFEPLNPNSTPYHIFGTVDEIEDVNEKNEALAQIALNFMPEPVGISQSDAGRYFLKGGRDILTASLIAFYSKGDDFIRIAEKVVRSSCEMLLAEIVETMNKSAIQYIMRFAGVENDKNTIGCCQAAQEAMALFATNEKIKKTIRRPNGSELCYTPSKVEKYNVFVNVPDSKLELLSPLLHIITAQTMEYFSSRPNYPENSILMVLDEFASLGRLDILPALRKYRKKKVRLLVLTQSLIDLDLIYGKNERIAMVNNFPFKVVLGLNELSEQRYFSELVGTKKVVKTTTQKGQWNTINGTSETETEEAIIKPSEFAKLGKDLILIYPDGWKRLRKNFFFK